MAINTDLIKSQELRNMLNGSNSLASKNNTAYALNADLLSEFIKRGGDINDLTKPFDASISTSKALNGGLQNISNNAASINPTISTPYQNVGGIVIPGVTRKGSALQTALGLINAGLQGYNASKTQQQDSINKAKTFVALQKENLRKEALSSEEKQKDRDSRESSALLSSNTKQAIVDKELQAKSQKEADKKEAAVLEAGATLKALNRSLGDLNGSILEANKYGYIGTKHATKRGILENEANGKIVKGSLPALLSHFILGYGGTTITDDDRKGYNALRAIEQIKLGEVTRNLKSYFTGKTTNMELELLNRSYFDRNLSFEDNVKNIKNMYYSILDKLTPEARKKYGQEISQITNLVDNLGTEPSSQKITREYLDNL